MQNGMPMTHDYLQQQQLNGQMQLQLQHQLAV